MCHKTTVRTTSGLLTLLMLAKATVQRNTQRLFSLEIRPAAC